MCHNKVFNKEFPINGQPLSFHFHRPFHSSKEENLKKIERLKRFGPVESNNDIPYRKKRINYLENDDQDQDHFKSVREEGINK